MIEVLKYENLKYFLVGFLLSLPFWWGAIIFEENLNEIFFLQEIAKNPQILTAQVSLEQIKKQKTLEVGESASPSTEANSAISVFIDKEGEKEILFEKEPGKSLPIASLAKLMTAFVALEYYPDLSQVVEVSPGAVFQESESGNLKIGEKLSIENLLYIMLLESSNDAAFALAELIGQQGFVDLMNWEAKNLRMQETFFAEPMGISPQTVSSSQDLVILTKKLLEYPLIWEILQKPEFDLYGPEGVFHHKLENTNQLLGKIDNIIGGKTGYTKEASGCFLLVLREPESEGYLINVILGTENRFSEMEKLIDWLTIDYKLQTIN